MHHVLQLHYTIQRRSYIEQYVVLFATSVLTFFATASWYIHGTLTAHLEQHDNLHGDDVVHKLVRKKRRKVAKLHPQLQQQQNDSLSTVRARFEMQHPDVSSDEMYKTVQAQHQAHPSTPKDLPYDIFNCPEIPPDGYPFTWNSIQLLMHWNPNNTTVPHDYIHQSLCVFDWNKEHQREIANKYRQHELPFVLQNHPDVIATAYRWSSSPDYLQELLGDEKQRNEHSTTNSMMFWRFDKSRIKTDWNSPTDNVQLSYSEWKQRADKVNAMTDIEQKTAEHWYFRLHAPSEDTSLSHYLYDELPYFRPQPSHLTTTTTTMFMIDSSQQRGINCRLGMKGTIAAAHFDPTRNWIVLLRGQRRYILAHPSQCQHLELFPLGHPSGRHSSVDWSDVDETYAGPFAQARLNEVLLQPADALYLPTNWFHYIVSLNTNAQCNARSGTTTETQRYIQQCGF